MNKKTAIATLEDASSAQWGMFTISQAKRLGVSRQYVAQLAKKGKVERLSSSVYRLSPAPTTSYDDIKAAWLSTNPEQFAYERLASKDYDVVVTGATAACLYEVGDLYASPYTFGVKQRRQTQRDDIRYLKSNWSSNDVTLVDGLPTARPEKVIADLVRAHEEPSLISDVAIDFEQAGHAVNLARLAKALATIRGNRLTPEDLFGSYPGYPLMLAREHGNDASLNWPLMREAFSQTAKMQKFVDQLQRNLQTLPDLSQIEKFQEQFERLRLAQFTPPPLSPPMQATLDRFADIAQHPDIQAAARAYQDLIRSNAAIQESLSESTRALKTFTERHFHE